MSKTQLQTNNSKLSALITELQGKAAGGGGGLTHVETPYFTYTVDAISGASYGFSINSSGYYESGNKGVNSSYAICRVHFTVNVACDITFDCINYAESNYDYGILGELDTALPLSNYEGSAWYKNFRDFHSGSVVNITYKNVSVGSHFVDIKFIKDVSGHENNDTLQFKVQDAPTYSALSEESLEMIRAEDADLTAENIKSGVDIFGVTGTYTGGSSGGAAETCQVTVNFMGNALGYGKDGCCTIYHANATEAVTTTTTTDSTVIEDALKGGLLIIALADPLMILGDCTTETINLIADVGGEYTSALLFNVPDSGTITIG